MKLDHTDICIHEYDFNRLLLSCPARVRCIKCNKLAFLDDARKYEERKNLPTVLPPEISFNPETGAFDIKIYPVKEPQFIKLNLRVMP